MFPLKAVKTQRNHHAKIELQTHGQSAVNSLGWLPEVDLKVGLAQAYAAFLQDAPLGPSSPQPE
jgi:hypothetical protein